MWEYFKFWAMKTLAEAAMGVMIFLSIFLIYATFIIIGQLYENYRDKKRDRERAEYRKNLKPKNEELWR